MLSDNKQSLWLGAGLIAVILLTRMQHFGNSVYLPDATLAVLFVGGLLVRRIGWLAVAIIAAFAMDGYALGWQGVSDYCMSLGYWGLIPTYALVWGAGRWLAKRRDAMSVVPYAASGWAAASIAFVLSNAFWYAFSDKVTTMPVLEFSQKIAQYYTPYVGYTLMYLGVAWVGYRFLASISVQNTSKV